jgi:hypothetical protein
MLKRKLAALYRRLPLIHELSDIRDSLADLRNQQRQLHAAQMVRLLDVELADHPRFGDPLRLLRYQAQVCSQNGEDGMVHEIFRRIGTTDRVFVEVGVGNGAVNNTAFLLSQGWRGAWVDSNGAFLRAVEDRDDLADGCLKTLVASVTHENVAGLFQQLDVPPEFDLLSLDIDQNTYFAWTGLADYRPRVVVVEYNAAIPPDIAWTVRYDPNRTWNATQNFGASLKSFELLGRRLGYSLVGCDVTGCNAFFVRDGLLGDHFAAPFTAENHYEPPRYALIHRRTHTPTILDRLPSG